MRDFRNFKPKSTCRQTSLGICQAAHRGRQAFFLWCLSPELQVSSFDVIGSCERLAGGSRGRIVSTTSKALQTWYQVQVAVFPFFLSKTNPFLQSRTPPPSLDGVLSTMCMCRVVCWPVRCLGLTEFPPAKHAKLFSRTRTYRELPRLRAPRGGSLVCTPAASISGVSSPSPQRFVDARKAPHARHHPYRAAQQSEPPP